MPWPNVTLCPTLGFILLFSRVPALAAGAPGDESETLAAEAIAANPKTAAIAARIAALDQQVIQSGAWLDPQVSIDYSNMPIDAWIPGEHPMSGVQFKLQQTFFYPQKTALRRAVAEGKVGEAHSVLAEHKVQLRASVKRAYYQLALVRQLRRVTEKHIVLVGQFLGAARAKYEVGSVGQHELLRLQVLEARLRDDRGDFERDERALSAMLNTTCRRALETRILTPSRLAVVRPPKPPKELALAAARHRPLLRQHEQRTLTHARAARRAARERYPDLTAWVGYRLRAATDRDAGTDFIGIGLSVPIPLFSKARWNSEQRTHQALSESAALDRDATLDQIRGRLVAIHARWQRSAEQAHAYQTRLMPMAKSALDATFSAYQVGRADFASLFQAELQLLAFEKTLLTAQANTHSQSTEAEAQVGQSLIRAEGDR